jgi:hypothetical protein
MFLCDWVRVFYCVKFVIFINIIEHQKDEVWLVVLFPNQKILILTVSIAFLYT